MQPGAPVSFPPIGYMVTYRKAYNFKYTFLANRRKLTGAHGCILLATTRSFVLFCTHIRLICALKVVLFCSVNVLFFEPNRLVLLSQTSCFSSPIVLFKISLVSHLLRRIGNRKTRRFFTKIRRSVTLVAGFIQLRPRNGVEWTCG